MDAAEFRRTSQAVWDAMAAGWDDRHAYIEQVARPLTELMLQRLEPVPGQTILELAGGTGVVGFAAAALVGPEGRVIVSDFSAPMVQAAQRHAAALGIDNVDCRVLDAERLDLPDASVDGVLCRWGYMLMADPEAALVQTRRVLRAGGRLSCSVFAGAEDNPWAALPAQVLAELGLMPAPQPGAPGILALADRARLRALFTRAGFSDPQIEEVAFAWHVTDADDYWRFLTSVAGAIAMVLERLDADDRARVRDAIDARVVRYEGAEGIALPALALVASAS